MKKLKIWLITVGEPLPIDGDAVRLYRTGMLASLLGKRGHKVTWWTSSFDHIQKNNRHANNNPVAWNDNINIHLIKALGYKKNMSLMRFIDHWYLKYNFEKMIQSEDRPDLILSSFPTIELSAAAVRYGNRYNIPVIIDVRDLWPDILVDVLPWWLKMFGRVILQGLFRETRFVFTNCYGILGVSSKYMEWGLNYGNRSAQGCDQVFPLAYPDSASRKNKQLSSDAVNALDKLQIDASKIIFLFVGTFGRTYDLSVVIEAIKKIEQNDLDNLLFVFCGDGEQSIEWKNMANAIPEIIFTGWVDSNLLNYFLSVSKVGIGAYKEGAPQGIPNKIIEYMSAGLPIISSLKGESKDLLDANQVGLTYDANDPDSFLLCLKEMLDTEKRKAMSIRSRDIFLRKYRAETVYNRYADYLENLV